jgi:hypothetical protein
VRQIRETPVNVGLAGYRGVYAAFIRLNWNLQHLSDDWVPLVESKNTSKSRTNSGGGGGRRFSRLPSGGGVGSAGFLA